MSGRIGDERSSYRKNHTGPGIDGARSLHPAVTGSPARCHAAMPPLTSIASTSRPCAVAEATAERWPERQMNGSAGRGA